MFGKVMGLLAQGSRAMGELADGVNDAVTRAKAVQDATYPLMGLVHTEKVLLKMALEHGKRMIDLDEQMKDPRFREAYEHVSKKVRGSVDHEPVQLPDDPLPSFERHTQHPDPETEQAIRNKIDGIRESRGYFLQQTVKELNGNSALKQHFLKAMEEKGITRYLASLKEAGFVE